MSFKIWGAKRVSTIAREINSTNMNLIWNNPNLQIKWDKIYPKCEGGLGIRRIQDVNATLLTNLGWKILIKPDTFGLELFWPNVSTKQIFGS